MSGLLIVATIFLAWGSVLTRSLDSWQRRVAAHNNDLAKNTWQASLAQEIHYDIPTDLQMMFGTKRNPNPFKSTMPDDPPSTSRLLQSFTLPQNYDLRLRFPKCSSLFTVRNQAGCGACWAFASMTSLSDRICIKTYSQRSPLQRSWSFQDPLECCPANLCGFEAQMGCNGGYIDGGFAYAFLTGVVSGEGYGNFTTCKPFFLAPGRQANLVPACTAQCTNPSQFPISYANDRRKILGLRIYESKIITAATFITQVKEAIFKRGSVVTYMDVYEDFMTYQSGIYQQKWGRILGGHAVRVIGWGFDADSGLNYWLCVNSWSKYWGDNGYFRIVLGRNEVLIEDTVVEGIV